MLYAQLYIILIRPERNVRPTVRAGRPNQTKSSAITATNASSMMGPVTATTVLTAATCDQNKAIKKHIASTIDCSTQSECKYIGTLIAESSSDKNERQKSEVSAFLISNHFNITSKCLFNFL